MKNDVLFCYGDFYPEQIKGYSVVVLESSHFSIEDIIILKENNKTVLGYISLGEVNKDAAHYEVLKEFTLGKNKLWDSYYLDLDNEETKMVLFNLFKENIEGKGLDGMFLDNIDNFTKYGPTPEKKEGLINLLKSVKETYPESYLLQNSGLLITEKTSPYINGIAIESVATDYDFKKNKYRLREKDEFKYQVEKLEEAEAAYNLPIILIEYADTKKLHDKLLDRIKHKSWSYFVGGIQLQKIPQF
jgi:hypothetical protein